MPENINEVKGNLGGDKKNKTTNNTSNPKSDSKTGAKAFNMAKSAGNSIGQGAEGLAKKGLSQEGNDENVNEVTSQMGQDISGVRNTLDNINQIRNRQNNFGANKANQQASEYLNGLNSGGNAEKAKQLVNANKGVAGKAGAKAGKAGGKAALKGAGAAAKKGIAALMSTPVGWAILILLAILLLFLLAYAMFTDDQENKQTGQYDSTTSISGEVADIEQTAYGVYYQKYSEMSIYAGVDLTNVEKGNEEAGCGDAVNFTDSCSGKTFEELTGVNPDDIDQEKIYQEGTKDWKGLKIADINGNEKYVSLSAGTLSQLDEKLHMTFQYPEQFIRPVAANCTLNMAEFLANDENDLDEDGKVTIKDCRLRNYNDEGEPEELEKYPSGDELYKDDKYWMDKTLYLTIAQSQKFKNKDGNMPEKSFDAVETVDDRANEFWDYGLGTIAHYVAYFQPSRVTDYGIETIDVICTDDGKIGNNIEFDKCAGKKFGDTITLDKKEAEKYSAKLISVYMGGTCVEDGENPNGCGGQIYIPAKEFYFKDWVEGYETYVENEEKLIQGDDTSYVYTDGIKTGEYPTTDTVSFNIYEPALSTGIPNTEVKYVIDHAVTFAGTIKFDVKQAWLNQAKSEHTQMLEYRISKDLEAGVDSSINSQNLTEHSNTGETIDYEYDVCLYYDGTMGDCGFSEDDHFIWVESTVTTEEDVGARKTEDSCTESPVDQFEYEKLSDAEKGSSYYDYDLGRMVYNKKSCTPVTHYYYVHTHTPGHYEIDGKAYYHGRLVNIDTIQTTETNENSANSFGGTGQADDDRDKYTWGEVQYATITAHKEGYLQTFAVYDSNIVPETDEIVGLDYLDEYIDNYKVIVPQFKDDKWTCYNSNEAIDDATWVSGTGQITNFEEAAKYSKGTLAGVLLDPTTGVTIPSSTNRNMFCYGHDKDDVILGSTKSLYLSNRPLLQNAVLGHKLGFVNDDDGNIYSNIAFTENEIKTSPGKNVDTKVAELGGLYADTMMDMAEMYGVDPTMLALIAAENDKTEGNLMNVKSGDYVAYNLGTRSPSTKHYGGSHDSDVENSFWQQVKQFFSKIPLFKKVTRERDTVKEGSKEELTVTVNGDTITAVNKEDGEELEDFTTEELSFKIAAMKLQYLQELYQYNMPMVITAYTFGEDYVEAVLEAYRLSTGVSREVAIASSLDTAWADFRAAFSPDDDPSNVYLEKELETAELLRTKFGISNADALEAKDYVERVIERLTKSGIYYQKVDKKYLFDDEELKEIQAITDVDTNTAQHAIGLWLYGNLVDTVGENNMNLSGASRGNILRAWGLLTNNDDGLISKDDWYEITGGQVRYPETLWDIGQYGGDSAKLYPAGEYFYYEPHIDEEERDVLVSDVMTFADDSYYSELDYNDVEFWRNHFSHMLGNGKSSWKSSMSAIDLFGEKPEEKRDVYEKDVPTTIERNLFNPVMPKVIIPYGYRNDEYGARKFSPYTLYQVQENTAGEKFEEITNPYNGKVLEVGENKDGHYLMMSIDNYKDIDIKLIIGHLSSVEVAVGDEISEAMTIGKVNSEDMFSMELIYNEDVIDFDEVFYSFPSNYNFNTWVPDGMGDPFGGIPGGNGGGSGYQGDPELVPGYVGPDLAEYLAQFDEFYYGTWTNKIIGPSPDNPYPRRDNGGLWCTAISWEIMSRMYPDKNWNFQPNGRGRQWAEQACKVNGFDCSGNEIKVGSIISGPSGHPDGHVQVVVAVRDNGEFCTANSSGGKITLTWFRSKQDFFNNFTVYAIATPND